MAGHLADWLSPLADRGDFCPHVEKFFMGGQTTKSRSSPTRPRICKATADLSLGALTDRSPIGLLANMRARMSAKVGLLIDE